MTNSSDKRKPTAGTATIGAPVNLMGTLALSLTRQNAIRLVSIYSLDADSLNEVAQISPDVLLLDGNMEQRLLFDILRQLRKQLCASKPLIVTDRFDHEFIGSILRYGAKGCLRTISSRPYLVKAILGVKGGEIWLERRLLAEALAAFVTEPAGADIAADRDLENYLILTDREREIVTLLSKGLTNKEIANQLQLSIETVKKYLRTIFLKLGVRRRTQVVLSRLCDRIRLS